MKKQIEIHKIDISSLLKSYNAELMDAYVIDNDFIKKVPTDKTTSLQKATLHYAPNNYENCIYNHRTTKTNQKYPSVNL